MSRRAVVALHRVFANQFEERTILQLKRLGDFKSLRRWRVREAMPEAGAAHRIGLLQAVAVSILMALIVPSELPVNVDENPSFRRAGKIIRRNHLVANCSQCARLVIAENIPIILCCGSAAADSKGCSTPQGTRGHKLPTRQKDALFAPPHRQSPRNGTNLH